VRIVAVPAFLGHVSMALGMACMFLARQLDMIHMGGMGPGM
jgi:hypothetical protein